VLESQGILGIRTFVGDPADLGEELLAHGVVQKGPGNYAAAGSMESG
jgi:hypothetical protein